MRGERREEMNEERGKEQVMKQDRRQPQNIPNGLPQNPILIVRNDNPSVSFGLVHPWFTNRPTSPNFHPMLPFQGKVTRIYDL